MNVTKHLRPAGAVLLSSLLLLSCGGKQKNNLVPACPDCNITKSDMSIEQFREKIENMLTSSMQGRMIAKYYGLERKPVKFFFEEVESGTIQNNINEFLDGQ